MEPGCRMKHGICAVGTKQHAGCFYIVVEDARQASGNNEIVWMMTPPNGWRFKHTPRAISIGEPPVSPGEAGAGAALAKHA
jgi:hypothetical protein